MCPGFWPGAHARSAATPVVGESGGLGLRLLCPFRLGLRQITLLGELALGVRYHLFTDLDYLESLSVLRVPERGVTLGLGQLGGAGLLDRGQRDSRLQRGHELARRAAIESEPGNLLMQLLPDLAPLPQRDPGVPPAQM